MNTRETLETLETLETFERCKEIYFDNTWRKKYQKLANKNGYSVEEREEINSYIITNLMARLKSDIKERGYILGDHYETGDPDTIHPGYVSKMAILAVKDYWRSQSGQHKLPEWFEILCAELPVKAYTLFLAICRKQKTVSAIKEDIHAESQTNIPRDEVVRIIQQLEQENVCTNAKSKTSWLTGNNQPLNEYKNEDFMPITSRTDDNNQASDEKDKETKTSTSTPYLSKDIAEVMQIILGKKIPNSDQIDWTNNELNLTEDQLIIIRYKLKEYTWEQIEEITAASGIKSPRYQYDQAIKKIQNYFKKMGVEDPR